MGPRDPHEPGRVATPLELLFDLVFVVAIASNAAQLHHAIVEHHVAAGLLGYTMSWFAIWWAWMGFTWFASAYDNDDAVYRVFTFVIMAGSLMLAASIPDLFADGQSGLAVAGYAVMRLGMVALWVRAALGDPPRRRTAVRYAVGILVVQVLWIARLWAPQSWLLPTFALLVLAELSVPYVAEGRQGQTPWHRHHIAERFSLMSIIVLGEVLLSSVMAVQDATHVGGSLIPLVVGGLLIVFGIWWIYFSHEHHQLTDGGAITWLFSYGHVIIFASIAAIGAGLGAAVDAVAQHGEAQQHVLGVEVAGAGGTAVWVMTAGVTSACLVLGGVHAVARRSVSTLIPAILVSVGTLVAAALPFAIQWRVLALGTVLALAVADHVRRSRADGRQAQAPSGDAGQTTTHIQPS